MAEWREIKGWPYEVSEAGEVRRNGGRILAARPHSNGYLRVLLCRPGEQRDFYIHRLVCEAFHGPAPEVGCEVDHRNNNRADNSAGNLRWLTIAANRARRAVRRGSAHGNAKLSDEAVSTIRRSSARTAELAAAYGVAPRTIRDARSGKLWRHVHA